MDSSSRPATLRWFAALCAMCCALVVTVGMAPTAAAAGTATLALSKNAFAAGTNDPISAPVTPGTAFDYQLSAACSGLTQGCINAKTVDVLPAGVVYNGADPSPLYTVSYDAATRTVTVVYNDTLGSPPNPAGSKGINAGSTRTAVLHVTLDPNATFTNGQTVSNKGDATADNTDPVSDTGNITVSVPRVVTPAASKTMTPNSFIAQSGASTAVRLTARNDSSASAQVTTLGVSDLTASTWDRFDLTTIGPVTQFPTGADQVSVAYCTQPARCSEAQLVTLPPVAGPVLTLPASVDPATVTGIAFRFSNAAGTPLPRRSTTADQGVVAFGLKLRDQLRSTGAPLNPTTPLKDSNCAIPTAVDAVSGPATGAQACSPYTIQPGTAIVVASKQFFPDTNGSYGSNGYAVAGESSGVSAVVNVRNDSAFPVTSLTITEPSTSSPNDFSAVAVTNVRLVFPAGATAATGTVTCGDGTTRTLTAAATGNQPTGCPVASPATRVSVTYTGSIAPGQSGQLGVHGTLNGREVGGRSLNDCADGTITNGQTSATGTACAALPVEQPRTTVGGVKNVSSSLTGGALVPGYPVTFTLQSANNGNLPLSSFVITDPAPGGQPNPFAVVALTSASLTTTPGGLADQFALEVTTDGGATWVPYNGADPALLLATNGIRARLTSGLVQPREQVTVTFSAAVRTGVAPGAGLTNCQVTDVRSARGAGTSGSVCAPALTVAVPATAGQVSKLIAPGSVAAPIPGVSQNAQVQLRAANTGNLPMKRIVIVDPDPGQLNPDQFFDQVDVVRVDAVNFPPGADQVQVDACLSAAACLAGTYSLGIPTGSATPGLPAGVTAGQVTGLRFTFTGSGGGFVLTPGANFPNSGPCVNATACFTVTPRTTNRVTAAPIGYPTSLSDVATAGGESPLSGGNLVSFGSAPAPLDVTAGTPKLTVLKQADAKDATVVTPGTPVAYSLKTTNSGTAVVPGLVVTEPLPAGLVFDSTFDGGSGLPYSISVTVPAGTPQPPTPTFLAVTDPTTNRLTELRWTYPESFLLYPTSIVTIGFQATLDPTIPAGTSVDNTFGAGTTDTTVKPTLTCDTGTPDPDLGCTDSASATAGTGSAVDAQKWVHGDDSRGFYNTRTSSFVPIGDPGCPLLKVGTDSYTRFPCVALTFPGQDFTFLLNITNVGTTQITETRLVDYLPKLGDTGVVVPGSRGTEWDPRPLLAGPPTLAPGSPGALSLAYAATSPTCLTDLDRPPTACPAGAWNPAFDGNAEAFRAFLEFQQPLAPGASARIVMPMSAPADLDTTTNPLPIAWNSFAHTDFFRQPNGSIKQLPRVEPIKVGIAMPFGNLQIVKKVTGDIPAGSVIGPFRGTYSCVVTTAAGKAETVRSGSFTFDVDQPYVVSHVPAGAVCSVVETDNGGGNPTVPPPVTVQPDTNPDVPAPTTLTVTNDFPAPRLIVTKAVTGAGAAYARGPFTVTVSCTQQGAALPDRVLTFDGEGSQSITDLPIGAECTVAETDNGGATSTAVAYADASGTGGDGVTIGALVDAVAVVTNTYDVVKLTVTKTVEGPGPSGPYAFAAACTLTSSGGNHIGVPLPPEDLNFTLSSGQSRTISVPTGAQCAVTEVNVAPGDTVTYNGAGTSPEVSMTGDVTLSVVNSFAPTPTPTTSPTPTPTTTSPGGSGGSGGSSGSSGSGGSLPGTGATVLPITAGGLTLIGLGGALWGYGRRRRSTG